MSNSNLQIEFEDSNGKMINLDFIRELGSGAHGLTLLFVDSDNNNNKYAVKFFYPSSFLTEEQIKNKYKYEYDTLNKIYQKIDCHKGIICFRAIGVLKISSLFYDEIYNILYRKQKDIRKSDILFIITDHIEGYELFSMIVMENGTPSISKFDVMMLTKKFLKLLLFLHNNEIAHTDIKPENIIYGNDRYNLIDFGTSCIKGIKCINKTGTHGYVPILFLSEKNLTFEDLKFQDIYSTLVVLYFTLTTYHPFNQNTYTPVQPNEIINDYINNILYKDIIANIINNFFFDVFQNVNINELRKIYKKYTIEKIIELLFYF